MGTVEYMVYFAYMQELVTLNDFDEDDQEQTLYKCES